MFETPKEVKPSASSGLWLAIFAVVLVGGIGGYLFITSKGKGSQAPPSAATAPVAAATNADPIHDLKVQRVTMNKDRTGTVAAWLVTIQNKSAFHTYSNIQYETTYVGADNNAILINTGKLEMTLLPGDQKNAEIHDALYPAGTAWYKFRITAASSAAQ
jgi:hypothetical protein